MIYRIFVASLILVILLHFIIKTILNSMDRAEVNLAIYNNRAPDMLIALSIIQLSLELVATVTGILIVLMIA